MTQSTPFGYSAPHGGGKVARVIHRLVGPQALHEVRLVRLGGGHHGGTEGLGHLNRVAADSAGRTDDQDGLPSRQAECVDGRPSRTTGQPERTRVLRVELLGSPGHAGRRNQRLLGEGALVQWIGEEHPEDRVAGGEVGDPGSHTGHGAREVPTEGDGKLVGHHVLHHPVGCGEVHAVDRRVLHVDDDLALAGLGRRQVMHGGFGVELVDGDGFHGWTLSFIDRGSGRMPPRRRSDLPRVTGQDSTCWYWAILCFSTSVGIGRPIFWNVRAGPSTVTFLRPCWRAMLSHRIRSPIRHSWSYTLLGS